MKNLITILLLTSTLTAFGQDVPDDYATTEANLKKRKKAAKEKMWAGAAVDIVAAIAYTTATIDQTLPEEGKHTVQKGSLFVAGYGTGKLSDGLIELIEVNKEIKAIKKARKNKKQD